MTLVLQFVAGLDAISAVVCGVDSLEQFEQLVAAINRPEVGIPAVDAAALACFGSRPCHLVIEPQKMPLVG